MLVLDIIEFVLCACEGVAPAIMLLEVNAAAAAAATAALALVVAIAAGRVGRADARVFMMALFDVRS